MQSQSPKHQKSRRMSRLKSALSELFRRGKDAADQPRFSPPRFLLYRSRSPEALPQVFPA